MSDDELERMLRRALAAEAGAVEPAGDGLQRIRARTRRPARARWRVPALALAGTAALIAAVFAVPPVLRDPAPSTAGGATAPSGPSAAGTLPGGSPSAADTPIPSAGVNDLTTVWPYPTRAEGFARAERDVAAGRYPDLTRADLAAVTFVGSYVGAAGLTATSLGGWQAGLRMQVERAGAVVSVVYLVRVRVGNDAPYVVVDATSPDLTLTAGPGLDGIVTAGGLRTARVGRPYVDMRPPGADEPLVSVRPATGPGGGEWGVELVAPGSPRPRVRTDAVAAWTRDPAGRVTAFAADSAAD